MGKYTKVSFNFMIGILGYDSVTRCDVAVKLVNVNILIHLGKQTCKDSTFNIRSKNSKTVARRR